MVESTGGSMDDERVRALVIETGQEGPDYIIVRSSTGKRAIVR